MGKTVLLILILNLSFMLVTVLFQNELFKQYNFAGKQACLLKKSLFVWEYCLEEYRVSQKREHFVTNIFSMIDDPNS